MDDNNVYMLIFIDCSLCLYSDLKKISFLKVELAE